MTMTGESGVAESGGDGSTALQRSADGDGGGGGGGSLKAGLTRLSLLWEGGSVFDAWLVASAAQIGQVVLTLPYTMSQMGIAFGISAIILYNILGAWSVYLLVWLYLEFKSRAALQQVKARPEGHILQYHEVIGGLVGRRGGQLTYFFVIVSLAIASVINLIASASDLYYADDRLNKREWQYVVGGVAFLAVLIPDYGHFRSGAVLGLFTTTITSLYLFVASLSHGQIAGVQHTGANKKVEFLTGATNILFAFGGHGITIEILETMRRPSKFKYVYVLVCVYTLCVTIPSAVAVYWAFGDVLLTRSNAFAVLPRSGWRTMAIASMVMHQGMAFVLFSHPVFLVWEKALGVHSHLHSHLHQHHSQHNWRRAMTRAGVRVPVVAGLALLALAVPFFGPINSVVGALLVTVAVYLIPLAAFLFTYRSPLARQNSAVKLPPFLPRWSLMFLLNGIIILWTVVVGVGLGGWASITNFVRQIHSFGFFDKCFQCPPSSSPK